MVPSLEGEFNIVLKWCGILKSSENIAVINAPTLLHTLQALHWDTISKVTLLMLKSRNTPIHHDTYKYIHNTYMRIYTFTHPYIYIHVYTYLPIYIHTYYVHT
jgi:hypothetical protein